MPNVKHKVNIADVITASRIIFAVCILFCPTFTFWFYTFYLLGAFTDMIDGPIARKLNLKSVFWSKTGYDCRFYIHYGGYGKCAGIDLCAKMDMDLDCNHCFC